jgi:hypothetical protein
MWQRDWLASGPWQAVVLLTATIFVVLRPCYHQCEEYIVSVSHGIEIFATRERERERERERGKH